MQIKRKLEKKRNRRSSNFFRLGFFKVGEVLKYRIWYRDWKCKGCVGERGSLVNWVIGFLGGDRVEVLQKQVDFKKQRVQNGRILVVCLCQDSDD